MELNEVEKKVLTDQAILAQDRFERLRDERDELQRALRTAQAKFEEASERWHALKRHLL